GRNWPVVESGSIVPNSTSSSPTKFEVTATRWFDNDTTNRSATAGPALQATSRKASVATSRRIIHSPRNGASRDHPAARQVRRQIEVRRQRPANRAAALI